MAATANSNPSSSLSSSAATLSPRSLPLGRTGSPPWAQIVRGPESESIGAPISPSASGGGNSFPAMVAEIPAETSENGGNAGAKKLAWNKKPTNVAVDNGGPGPVVMGPAEAWPALSESTKASPKPSSSDSSKILADTGSISSSQVTGTESSSQSVASSVQSQSQSSSTSPKPTSSNLNHNSMPNHGRPTRQKSMKRDGGGNPQTNGGTSHQPSSPSEGSHNYNHSSPKPNFGGGSDSFGRETIQNHGNRESGSRNASGDHPQPRNSFRRGGGGSHSRGDGAHQNYGGRRGDQDRGNHDWNHQRSFNGRDAQRVSPRAYVRPPPAGVAAPFAAPPMRPTFINPLVDFYLPSMTFVPSAPIVPTVPPPVFLHTGPDPLRIMTQIEYYFSNENLIKDTYLRQNMDGHGWVPMTLVANFKKVMELTQNIQQILDAVRSSTKVEVQGDKIRKRDDWMRWIMPASVQFPTAASGSQSPRSPTIAALSSHIQAVKLDDKVIDQDHPKGQLDVNAVTVSRSSSGDMNVPLQSGKDGASSSSH